MSSGNGALILDRPGEFRLAPVPEPATEPGQVVVEPVFVGLCGTDLHIVAGEHPRAALPLALGHEIVGVPTSGRWAGRPVIVDPTIACGHCPACLRGQAQVCARLRLVGIDRDGGLAGRVAVAETKLHPVPDALPLATAALAEPLAVAVHAVDRAGPLLGRRVVVFGAGPIGLLISLLARASGALAVVLAEPAGMRRAVADQLGFDAVADPAEVPAQLGGLADVAFDAAAVPASAAQVTGLVLALGMIVMVGVHGRPALVDLQAVTFGELRLAGTRVYQPADIRTALALLAGGTLDTAPLLSEVVDLAGAPAALERLARGEALKVLVACAGQR